MQLRGSVVNQGGVRVAGEPTLSLRQPVERAEGLRDEGQESPARVPPVLPVRGGLLQEKSRVSSVSQTSNGERCD